MNSAGRSFRSGDFHVNIQRRQVSLASRSTLELEVKLEDTTRHSCLSSRQLTNALEIQMTSAKPKDAA